MYNWFCRGYLERRQSSRRRLRLSTTAAHEPRRPVDHDKASHFAPGNSRHSCSTETSSRSIRRTAEPRVRAWPRGARGRGLVAPLHRRRGRTSGSDRSRRPATRGDDPPSRAAGGRLGQHPAPDRGSRPSGQSGMVPIHGWTAGHSEHQGKARRHHASGDTAAGHGSVGEERVRSGRREHERRVVHGHRRPKHHAAGPSSDTSARTGHGTRRLGERRWAVRCPPGSVGGGCHPVTRPSRRRCDHRP